MKPAKAARQPVEPSEGPWLIRSHYWNSWHRNQDGHAAGYTDRLENAGIFPLETALAYHDLDPKGRDEAVPVSRVLADMEADYLQKRAECEEFAAKVAAVRRAAGLPPPTYTERVGLGEALLASLLAENLKRVADHLDTWARDHTEEATAETWAALHCAREALASAEAAATNKTA